MEADYSTIIVERFKLLRVKKQQFGRIFGKKEFLDMEHFGKQHDRTFPLLLLEVSSPTFPLLSGPFNAFFLLDFKFGWRGAQVGFSVSILGAESYNSAQASTLGEHFLASGPWIHQPMIHDVTKLKKLPRWGSLAARQTFSRQ